MTRPLDIRSSLSAVCGVSVLIFGCIAAIGLPVAVVMVFAVMVGGAA